MVNLKFGDDELTEVVICLRSDTVLRVFKGRRIERGVRSGGVWERGDNFVNAGGSNGFRSDKQTASKKSKNSANLSANWHSKERLGIFQN